MPRGKAYGIDIVWHVAFIGLGGFRPVHILCFGLLGLSRYRYSNLPSDIISATFLDTFALTPLYPSASDS